MNPNNIELLAPAGSYEGFEAALGAGADAVYVGGAMFGARAYAQNFNEEELLRAIDVAHIHGKKLYLTVNTLLKNRELKEELVSYLEPYYNAGLDAVIVQDMGVFSLLKKEFPKLHLHASTQMTVTGPEDKFTPEDIAESINMSYSNFRKSFKQYTGIAPHQYMLQLKLSKIKDLLSSTEMSIQDIAMKLNFESADYFSYFFRSKTGINPLSYRKEIEKQREKAKKNSH